LFHKTVLNIQYTVGWREGKMVGAWHGLTWLLGDVRLDLRLEVHNERLKMAYSG